MKTIAILAALALLSACGPTGGTDQGANVTDETATATNTTSENATTGAVATVAPANRWTSQVHDTKEGFVVGNPDARHKLVEYGSRTCPACGRFARDGMKELLSGYVAKGDVSYEFRDFLVHGAPDLAAALVGTCGDPARRFDILEANYTNQTRSIEGIQNTPQSEIKALEGGKPERILLHLGVRGGYIEQAAKFGVDETKSRACLADTKKAETLVAVTNGADPKIVTGTPTFILNGKSLGVHDWAGVKKALDQAISPR